jgi:hypothetical protein
LQQSKVEKKKKKKNSYLLQQFLPAQAIKASSSFTQDFFTTVKGWRKKILSFATVFTNPDLVGYSYVFVLGSLISIHRPQSPFQLDISLQQHQHST